jgi:hypothetical protein
MEIVATGFGDLSVLKTVKTDFCLPGQSEGKLQSASLERTAMTTRPVLARAETPAAWRWLKPPIGQRRDA